MEYPKFAALDIDFVFANQRHYIYQIGVAISKDGKIMHRNYMVEPPKGHHYEVTFGSKTVSSKKLEGAKPFPDIWVAIQNALQNANFIAAHNAQIDKMHLLKALQEHGLEPPELKFVNTVLVVRKIFGFKKAKLDSALARLGLSKIDSSAGAEARACAELIILACDKQERSDWLKEFNIDIGTVEALKNAEDTVGEEHSEETINRSLLLLKTIFDSLSIVDLFNMSEFADEDGKSISNCSRDMIYVNAMGFWHDAPLSAIELLDKGQMQTVCEMLDNTTQGGVAKMIRAIGEWLADSDANVASENDQDSPEDTDRSIFNEILQTFLVGDIRRIYDRLEGVERVDRRNSSLMIEQVSEGYKHNVVKFLSNECDKEHLKWFVDQFDLDVKRSQPISTLAVSIYEALRDQRLLE